MVGYTKVTIAGIALEDAAGNSQCHVDGLGRIAQGHAASVAMAADGVTRHIQKGETTNVGVKLVVRAKALPSTVIQDVNSNINSQMESTGSFTVTIINDHVNYSLLCTPDYDEDWHDIDKEQLFDARAVKGPFWALVVDED